MELTDNQKVKIQSLNKKWSWGISDNALCRLITQHQNAYKKHDELTMAKIEYRLHNIDRQDVIYFLETKKYDELKNCIKSKQIVIQKLKTLSIKNKKSYCAFKISDTDYEIKDASKEEFTDKWDFASFIEIKDGEIICKILQ